MAYASNTFSYGTAYAGFPVVIVETSASTNPGAPAIIMASATGGVLSTTGQFVLDVTGSMTVFLDNSKVFSVTIQTPQSALYALPTSTSFPPSQSISSGAYTKSLVVKQTAGRLLTLTIYNSNTAAQFIQLHDANSLPADGAVPVSMRAVPGSSTYVFDYGLRGRSFANGIVACSSSTGPTKTIGAGTDVWFSAEFL